MYYELTDQFIVKSDLSTTWDFFSKAENLPRITPAWMKFEIKTAQPIQIQQDSILDYTIHWMGIPIGWRTRIIDWSPPRQFIDLQLRGPYSVWHHQHTFAPGDEGTICRDRVTYKVPVPILGRILNAAAVQRQLIGIFEFRRKVITEHLGWVRALQEKVTVQSLI
jgi:ligand-binding SRPBCC domain-containing protein